MPGIHFIFRRHYRRISRRLLTLLTVSATACASSGAASSGSNSSFEADASTITVQGLTIQRLQGWNFVKPDASVGKDTVVVMYGPQGQQQLAPAVEVTLRKLTARDQRRKPLHILTQMMTEIVQLFEGFEAIGGPSEMKIGGAPGARLDMKITESLSDGGEVQRVGRFYGIVHQGRIWLIRCLGSTDGSHDPDFDQLIQSLSVDS